MRLETAAAKLDRIVRLPNKGYDQEAADLRELLQEAASRIKQLEAIGNTDWTHDTCSCGNG
jgi:hypothetical protein